MTIHDVLIILSKSKLNDSDKQEIRRYFDNNDSQWCLLLGELLYHKIQARAWLNMSNCIPLKHIPKFVRNCLSEYYRLYEYKKNIYTNNFIQLLGELNDNQCCYCILKGLPIEKDLFENSARECDDIDILISYKDIKKFDSILKQLGYVRGFHDKKEDGITNDRQQALFFLLNTHQTLPYHKLESFPLYQFEIVDLQFEFTLKKKFNYIIDTEEMLNNRMRIDINGVSCNILSPFDNFLLLCTHLYGEAILISEIEKYKDLQIKKIADINEWINKYYYMFDWAKNTKFIKERGFTEAILFCTYLVANLYDSKNANQIIEYLSPYDMSFLDEYRDASFNKKTWKIPLLERVFRTDRINLL